MKKQFLLFASALLLTACSKPYSVTVDYGNKNDGMQVYLQNYFTGEIIDSTTFADGKAVFNGKTGRTTSLKLHLPTNRRLSSSNRAI